MTHKAGEPDMAVTVEKQRNGEFEGRVSAWFDLMTFRLSTTGRARSSPTTT